MAYGQKVSSCDPLSSSVKCHQWQEAAYTCHSSYVDLFAIEAVKTTPDESLPFLLCFFILTFTDANPQKAFAMLGLLQLIAAH